MNRTLILRFALAYTAFFSAQIGFWALLAPRSFYDSFPGMGRAWIAIDGPYNEHLIRDVGALNLALLAILIYAIVKPTRELLTVASMAVLVWGVPHFIYHLFNAGDLDGIDAVASLGGLIAFVAFGAVALQTARSLPDPEQIEG